MDLLRGTAIVLVVVFHAAATAAERMAVPPAVTLLNEQLGPIRMPLMVALSGMLVGPSMAKGFGTYFSGKLRRIAWPYLLWTVPMLAILVIRVPELQVPEHLLERVLVLPLRPIDHLWFLYYLFGYYVIAWVARSVQWWISPVALIVLAGVAELLDLEAVHPFAYLGGFFMLGAAVSARPELLNQLTRPGRAVRLFAVGAGGGLAISTVIFGSLRYEVLAVPLVVLVSVGLMAVARAVEWSRWSRPLIAVGRNSLPYYLIHYPVLVGLVASIGSLLPGVDFLPLFVLEVGTGLAAGLVLSHVAQTRWGGWLTQWPTRRTGGPGGARPREISVGRSNRGKLERRRSQRPAGAPAESTLPDSSTSVSSG